MKRLRPDVKLGRLEHAATAWLTPERFAAVFPVELFSELAPFEAPSPGKAALLDLGNSVQALVSFFDGPGFLNVEVPENVSNGSLLFALSAIGVSEQITLVRSESPVPSEVSATPGLADSGEEEV